MLPFGSFGLGAGGMMMQNEGMSSATESSGLPAGDPPASSPTSPTEGPPPQGMGMKSGGLPPGIMKYFPEWLATNPMFSAGFGLAGVGVCIGFMRNSMTLMETVLRRKALTSLEIPSKDYSYQWVMQWLIARHGRNTQHIGVETTHSKDKTGRVRTLFDFVPSPGRHFMKYEGAYFLVERQRETKTVDMTSGSPWETVTLTTLGYNQHLFSKMLQEARDMAVSREEGKTSVYQAFGHEWRPFGQPRKVRPFNSVILQGNTAEDLLKDVKEFQRSTKWYLDRGIPYRRGYLLYGPPGSGKTSYVTALAGELGYGIAVLNLGDPGLTDDRLSYLLTQVPPNCLILLEDVDGLIPDMDGSLGGAAQPQESYPGLRRLTFSGLLNALDGVVATEERLIFMTTNRVHKLPPVLIRPGRVDVKVYIGAASEDQLEKMFLRFFPKETERAKQFSDSLSGSGLSMAEVQGFFLYFKDDPAGCLEKAPQFAEHMKSALTEKEVTNNFVKKNQEEGEQRMLRKLKPGAGGI